MPPSPKTITAYEGCYFCIQHFLGDESMESMEIIYRLIMFTALGYFVHVNVLLIRLTGRT